MSRKRGKKEPPASRRKAAVEAIPEDVLAEGSGPVRSVANPIATVEDVVTTDDIATTDDVVTADDVVATEDPAGAVPDEPAAAAPGPDAGDAIADHGDPAAMAASSDDHANGSGHTSDVEIEDGYAADGDEVADLDAASDLDGAAGSNGADDSDDSDDSDDAADAADGETDEAIVFPTSAASMDATQLKHLVEALVFASDRPLTVARLRQLTRVSDVRRLEQALSELAEDYRERGLILQQVSGGYHFRTRTQFSAWVQQLIAGRPVRLSRAQLETLAIIAYRQPITRPEIDDIRGVDSSQTLKLLIDRMLIRVLGKREEVGRPILYGTTKEFLDFFSLGDLRELPTLREYSELTAESRKVMSDRLGLDPDGGVHPIEARGTNGTNGTNGTHGSHLVDTADSALADDADVESSSVVGSEDGREACVTDAALAADAALAVDTALAVDAALAADADRSDGDDCADIGDRPDDDRTGDRGEAEDGDPEMSASPTAQGDERAE